MNAYVKEWQRDLAKIGLPLDDDGLFGPGTLRAGRAALAMIPAKEPVLINPPDTAALDDMPETAEAKLKGVHIDLVAVVREASLRCAVPFTVIEGLRTADRQRQLVAAGASKTLNSRHLTGHAVDLWPLDLATGRALPAGTKDAEVRLWADLRVIAGHVKSAAKDRGVMIEWGGDWGWDGPHFQLNRSAYPG